MDFSARFFFCKKVESRYILQPKTGEGMMKIEGMTFIFEHFFGAKMRVKELETQKETH